MKVLVVGLNYAPEPTGIAPYTAGLSRGLASRGHRVRVLTTMPHYPEWRVRAGYGGWRRRESLDGAAVERLRHYVPTRPSGVRRLTSELSFGARVALARWGHPDVVVLVSPALFSSGIAMVRARLVGVPAVVWVQDVYSLGVVETQGQGESSQVANGITAVESAILTSASGVSVIHRRFVDVVKRLGVDAEQVAVVRNWTHLSNRWPAQRASVRKRLGWGDGEVIVLHSGAMGKKQDLDNVVRAAKVAEARGTTVRFVLMGNGGERSRLEQSAVGASSVAFLDPLPGDRFQDALAAADVLLVNEHAGLREMAVPSKLTSYFSSGRPVLAATDADSVTAEEIAASGGGVRVEPGQPGLLVDAALELGQDAERSKRLGMAGKEYQRAVLSESAALDTYAAWLEKIVADHRPGTLLERLKAMGRVVKATNRRGAAESAAESS